MNKKRIIVKKLKKLGNEKNRKFYIMFDKFVALAKSKSKSKSKSKRKIIKKVITKSKSKSIGKKIVKNTKDVKKK